MARINIEENLFSDQRFIDLVLKVQSNATALGMLVLAWRLAQKWYLSENRMIPVSEWQKQRMSDEIIEVGLAKKVGNYIEMSGADEQFSWLVQKKAAGKLGGEAKSLKAKKKVAHVAGASGRQAHATTRLAEPTLFTPSSLLSSPSSDLTTHNSELLKKDPPEVAQKKTSAPPEVKTLIAHYCDSWRKAYRTEKSPPISGRDAKTFSGLIKDFGFERAKLLVTAYLKMPDQWFIKKRHDITTLTTNLNAVALFADSGKMISNQELKDLDKSLNQKNLIDAVERGEV